MKQNQISQKLKDELELIVLVDVLVYIGMERNTAIKEVKDFLKLRQI